jgi:sRNA-binding carbon storage regulator CsrA
MLVLSRKVGESIIIDSKFTATVAVVGADFVDLGLSEVGGTRLGYVTLNTHKLAQVIRGVRGIMVERIEEGRVSLGFESPSEVWIGRSEIQRAVQEKAVPGSPSGKKWWQFWK